MDRYQSYFRKLKIFFSEQQQGAVRTDQKFILLSTIFNSGNNFQSTYITIDIFFNNSTFFGITEKTNEKGLYTLIVRKI